MGVRGGAGIGRLDAIAARGQVQIGIRRSAEDKEKLYKKPRARSNVHERDAMVLTLREGALARDYFPKWPGTRLPGLATLFRSHSLLIPFFSNIIARSNPPLHNFLSGTRAPDNRSFKDWGLVLISFLDALELYICQYQNIHRSPGNHSKPSSD